DCQCHTWRLPRDRQRDDDHQRRVAALRPYRQRTARSAACLYGCERAERHHGDGNDTRERRCTLRADLCAERHRLLQIRIGRGRGGGTGTDTLWKETIATGGAQTTVAAGTTGTLATSAGSQVVRVEPSATVGSNGGYTITAPFPPVKTGRRQTAR